MSDGEILNKVREILDKAFEADAKGVVALMLLQAHALDEIEILLTKHGYPTEAKDKTYAA